MEPEYNALSDLAVMGSFLIVLAVIIVCHDKKRRKRGATKCRSREEVKMHQEIRRKENERY